MKHIYVKPNDALAFQKMGLDSECQFKVNGIDKDKPNVNLNHNFDLILIP